MLKCEQESNLEIRKDSEKIWYQAETSSYEDNTSGFTYVNYWISRRGDTGSPTRLVLKYMDE
jgi:hypothetical protein